jgi:DNA-binding beta-propeller fold protein YncE
MRYILLVSAALVGLAFPQPSTQPLVPISTIELPGVEGRIDHLAFDPDRGHLFVAALGNNSVEVIDAQSGKHLKHLPGFEEPQGIAFLSDAHAVAIANGQGPGVQTIDAVDFHPLRAISLGDDSDNVRYDGAAKRFYVGYGGGAIAAIDPADGRVLGRAPLGGHPESFQLETQGPRIYVNVPSAGHIAVVDRNSMRVTATWPVTAARANYPMALDEEGKRLFVGCRRPAVALVYDLSSGTQVSSFPIVGDTDDLFFDAERKRLYVTGGDGSVDVFSTEAGKYDRLAHIATAAGARTSLFVKQQSRLYVAVPHRGTQRASVLLFDAR